MNSRVEDAVKAFEEEGCNCAQAVFATYADLFGVDRETAMKLTAALGGGISRMREVCGTVNAMALLAGLKQGSTNPRDMEAKTRLYEQVQSMSEQFKQESGGSIVCRELLGRVGQKESAKPDVRSAEYYRKRPCSGMVACAAKIVEETLLLDDFM